MLRKIIAYFRFLARSTNDHGVHSPFVYSLITKCLYDRKYHSAYDLIDKHRSRLLNDHTVIQVTDFGAGSKVFKSNDRKVSAIARYAGISRHRAKMLYRITAYLRPQQIVEIGTSAGLATLSMAVGNPEAAVHSAEGCPQTIIVANDHLMLAGISNVNLYNLEFNPFLTNVRSQQLIADLVYIDGNHTQNATLSYFEDLLPMINESSVLIFDDIHWSEEMERAWETIKNNPKVTVTIDTFQWGFVFFRKGQEKEHFTIRC